MMFGWGLLILLVVGAVVLALVPEGAGWLRQGRAPRPPYGKDERGAREILDQRLARGEIDGAEYEAIRARMEHE